MFADVGADRLIHLSLPLWTEVGCPESDLRVHVRRDALVVSYDVLPEKPVKNCDQISRVVLDLVEMTGNDRT